MADRIEVFDVTVTAGTAATAPTVTDVSFAPGTVEGVEIVIPDGVAGLAGWRLLSAHQAVIPNTAGRFITGNDETVKWPLDGYLNTGSWQFEAYNTDVYDHTFEIRFLVNEIDHVTPGPSSTGPIAAIEPTVPIGDEQPPGGGLDQDGGQLPTEPPDDGTGTGTGDLPPDDSTDIPPVPDDSGDSGTGDLPADDTLPPDDALPDDTGDTAPDGAIGATSPAGRGKSGGKGGRRKPPHKPGKAKPGKRTKAAPTVTEHVSLPAGGWLPHGARFTLRRIDQGQDFITDWRGPIIAPGPGVVKAIRSDRPFPNGFGPRYAVVTIESGRWAGKTLYIGHATAAVNAGEHFHTGHVLAHADQGHVEGGGWVELGEESALGHGIHNQGAAIAHLFSPERHAVHRKAPSHDVARKGKGSGHVPAPRRSAARTPPPRAHHAPAPAVHRAPARVASRAPARSGGHSTPAARRAPAPAVSHPAAPAPRRAPAPPPPPARRAPAPPARRRR